MISRRASEICPSKTIAISQKVNELKKSGFDIIDLSIGEPDFPIPSAAKKYVEVALKENKTKYDNVRGLEKLRDEVSKKLLNENFLNYSLAEIIISTGAKQPIYNSILATCDVGDEIIIPSPYWVSYIEIAKIACVTPIIIETKVENEFKITANDLSSYINPKVKAILFSNPCNPTGSIYSKEELEEIAEVCLQNNILIISDEIYERIYYDVRPISIASISEAIKNITIVVNGFSKSCAMTGLRVGYTASRKDIADKIASIQGHITSHPSLISQYAALGALCEGLDDVEKMVEEFKVRRNYVLDFISSIPKISFIEPLGAFYLFFKIENHLDSMKLCEELLEKYNLALVPSIAFGVEGYLRMSYAADLEVIKKGLNAIKSFIIENN